MIAQAVGKHNGVTQDLCRHIGRRRFSGKPTSEAEPYTWSEGTAEFGNGDSGKSSELEKAVSRSWCMMKRWRRAKNQILSILLAGTS